MTELKKRLTKGFGMIEGHLKSERGDTRTAMLRSGAACWTLLDVGFAVDLNGQRVDAYVAPERTHAVRWGLRENVRRREAGRGRVEADGRGLKPRVGYLVQASCVVKLWDVEREGRSERSERSERSDGSDRLKNSYASGGSLAFYFGYSAVCRYSRQHGEGLATGENELLQGKGHGSRN
ncbi:hypothetical protein EYF80_031462 [Liparis tanakae]|uniref:Uncharacterized protein n=1 Tax=Liparis tanakae TaxID=230148 RepID=A0A4Z2GYK7_9TELE|nr:hypothetical protein EYF80_031462 [Liparis tanakae]